MINCFQNLHPSKLSNKWRFDSSQDWDTLILDFDSFSMDDIADETFSALGFHTFATWYLEERSLHFTDVTDLELNVEPAIVDNLG